VPKDQNRYLLAMQYCCIKHCEWGKW